MTPGRSGARPARPRGGETGSGLGPVGRVVRRRGGGGRWRCGRCLGLGRPRRRRDASPESERIASAADFRDDVSDDPARASGTEAVDEAPAPGQRATTAVYAADDAGTDADMSDDARTETAEHASHDDGLEAGGAAAAASAGAGGAYAATRPCTSRRHDAGGPRRRRCRTTGPRPRRRRRAAPRTAPTTTPPTTLAGRGRRPRRDAGTRPAQDRRRPRRRRVRPR